MHRGQQAETIRPGRGHSSIKLKRPAARQTKPYTPMTTSGTSNGNHMTVETAVTTERPAPSYHPKKSKAKLRNPPSAILNATMPTNHTQPRNTFQKAALLIVKPMTTTKISTWDLPFCPRVILLLNCSCRNFQESNYHFFPSLQRSFLKVKVKGQYE